MCKCVNYFAELGRGKLLFRGLAVEVDALAGGELVVLARMVVAEDATELDVELGCNAYIGVARLGYHVFTEPLMLHGVAYVEVDCCHLARIDLAVAERLGHLLFHFGSCARLLLEGTIDFLIGFLAGL